MNYKVYTNIFNQKNGTSYVSRPHILAGSIFKIAKVKMNIARMPEKHLQERRISEDTENMKFNPGIHTLHNLFAFNI